MSGFTCIFKCTTLNAPKLIFYSFFRLMRKTPRWPTKKLISQQYEGKWTCFYPTTWKGPFWRQSIRVANKLRNCLINVKLRTRECYFNIFNIFSLWFIKFTIFHRLFSLYILVLLSASMKTIQEDCFEKLIWFWRCCCQNAHIFIIKTGTDFKKKRIIKKARILWKVNWLHPGFKI